MTFDMTDSDHDSRFDGVRPAGFKIIELGSEEPITKGFTGKQFARLMKAVNKAIFDEQRERQSQGRAGQAKTSIPETVIALFDRENYYIANILARKCEQRPKQALQLFTVVSGKENAYEIVPEVFMLQSDQDLECLGFAFEKIVPLGEHNSHFFRYVKMLLNKIDSNTFTANDAHDFVYLWFSGMNISNKYPSVSCFKTSTVFFRKQENEVKVWVFMGAYNNKFTLGAEVGASKIATTTEELAVLGPAIAKRLEYFMAVSSLPTNQNKRKRKTADHGEGQADLTPHYNPDYMRTLSFPAEAIVAYIKRKIDPVGWETNKNKDTKHKFEDFYKHVVIDMEDMNIWQALASVVDVSLSVDFMRAILIQVLSKDADGLKDATKNFMVEDEYFQVEVDKRFLLPFEDKIGDDRVVELEQFFCYARKYFMMLLAQNEADNNMVSTAAILIVHAQRMAYEVVTQFITHDTQFVLDTLIDGTLGVCCDAKRSLVLHLAPAVLTNLVCLFLIDAYNRYQRKFGNMKYFGLWILQGEMHESVKLNPDGSLNRPNLADMTDYAAEVEEPEWCGDVPLSKVAFSCLPIRVDDKSHPSNFSLCGFKNITDDWNLEVQYVLSLQGLVRSDQKITLLKDLKFSHRCIMNFMIHKKFEPLEKYIFSLCHLVRHNYDAIFLYEEPGYGKVLAKILEENSRDIVYGLVLYHADLFNLNDRRQQPVLTLNEFAVRFKEAMADVGSDWTESEMGIKEKIDLSTCPKVSPEDLNCIKQMIYVSMQDQSFTIIREKYLVSTAFLSMDDENSALVYGGHSFWQNDPYFDYDLYAGDFHVKLAEFT